MVKITLCFWNLDPNNQNNIGKVVRKLESILNREVSITTTDIKISEPPIDTDICIGFGDIAYNSIPEEIESWRAPELSLLFGSNKIYREQLTETFNEIKEELGRAEQEEKKVLQVEKQEVTFGKNAQINITPQEVEYLKGIKDILGGGAIIIKKDDLEIRIEDDNNKRDTGENS